MKRQVHKIHGFKMFITAACVIFLIKMGIVFYSPRVSHFQLGQEPRGVRTWD